MKFLLTHRRTVGILAITLACILSIYLIYELSPQRRQTIAFSTTTMLESLWQSYNSFYLDPTSHRTIDPSRNSITTSEGESYTMLRAAWIGDKTTFDQSWTWTQTNLQRPQDHLFSWQYGKLANGNYGILTDQGGQNTASDADSDIAFALLLAYSRWQDPSYLQAAQAIIPNIWNTEVVTINGIPYLAADNVEKVSTSPSILVNPSYYSPYAYRVFAKVDTTHPWNSLVDSSYTIVTRSIQAPLNATSSANLPPDWVLVNRTTGDLTTPASSSNLTTNFGYDAIRTPWRFALDWEWNKDPRDQQVLSKMTFLSDTYNQNGKIYATYAHDGSMIKNASSTDVYGYESASLYGATIGYFMVADPALAPQVYNDKLLYLFDSDNNDWKQRLPYYDDNWAWFGLALYNNRLENLTQNFSLPAAPTQL